MTKKTTWEKDLKNVLMGGKYCWTGNKFNEEEFYGYNDQMGWYDHVRCLVEEVEKQTYLAAYLQGTIDLAKELEKENVIDVVVNQVTAERKYLDWR